MPTVTKNTPPPAPVPPPTYTMELSQEEAQALYNLLNFSGRLFAVTDNHCNRPMRYTRDNEETNTKLFHALNERGLTIQGQPAYPGPATARDLGAMLRTKLDRPQF